MLYFVFLPNKEKSHQNNFPEGIALQNLEKGHIQDISLLKILRQSLLIYSQLKPINFTFFSTYQLNIKEKAYTILTALSINNFNSLWIQASHN